ncbi:MAG: GNAT family N-acetyltransferase [Paracoccus aminovorans]|nr:GNAT family N-acetyltransferase [Paracoccus aminovorans]
MTQTLTFHDFGPRHLDDALALSQAAGWPHRREDWALIAGLSRGAVACADGRVVATALATPFGPVAMANMIIVDAAMRGRGLGREIMQRALRLAEPREWRLVATQPGLPLYRKLGFQDCGLVHQHQGLLPALAPPPGVRLAGPQDSNAIAAMDRAATGADRGALLARLAGPGRVALDEGGAGFAVLRDFGRGQLVGPVIARDAAAARRLVGWLLAGRAGQFMRIDTPQDADGDAGLSDWLAGLGLARVDTGIAMRRGAPDPDAAPAANPGLRRFALAAQALG